MTKLVSIHPAPPLRVTATTRIQFLITHRDIELRFARDLIEVVTRSIINRINS